MKSKLVLATLLLSGCKVVNTNHPEVNYLGSDDGKFEYSIDIDLNPHEKFDHPIDGALFKFENNSYICDNYEYVSDEERIWIFKCSKEIYKGDD